VNETILITDIDNTLFNFSKLALEKEEYFKKIFPGKIKFNSPFHFYHDFIKILHEDEKSKKEIKNYIIKHLIQTSFNYSMEGLKLIEDIIIYKNIKDIFFVTNRLQHSSHSQNAEWLLKNINQQYNTLTQYVNESNVDKHLLLFSTEERLQLIQELNNKNYSCILIDDSPESIENFISKKLYEKNSMLIPEWGYNQNLKKETVTNKMFWLEHSHEFNYNSKESQKIFSHYLP